MNTSNTKRIALIGVSMLTAVLGGCESGELAMTPEARAQVIATEAKRGAARTGLFKECMELAAKMPRQADDDVSDIVDECSSQAWYMTNHIK